MAEDRRTPDRSSARQRELEAKIDELTRQLADVVNTAGVESRQELREYTIGLLKEETERDDAVPTSAETHASTTNFSPLAFAILIGPVSLLLMLLFPPLGMGLFVVAAVMGIWGLIGTLVVRR